MGWQRFNRGTNVFEVSDDNGASWQVLKIAASGLNLSGNIAYLDVVQNFTKVNSFNAGLNVNGAVLNANTGLTVSGAVTTINNGINMAGGLTSSGTASFTQTLQLLGGNPRLALIDNAVVADNRRFDLVPSSSNLYIQSMTDVGGVQAQFVFGRTGHFQMQAGNIYPLNVILQNPGGGLYEKNRGFPLGDWNNYTPTITDSSGNALSASGAPAGKWTIIGRTLFFEFSATFITTPVSTLALKFTAPPGYPATDVGRPFYGSCLVHAGTGVPELAYWYAGGGTIDVARNNNTAWVAGYSGNHIYGAIGFYTIA